MNLFKRKIGASPQAVGNLGRSYGQLSEFGILTPRFVNKGMRKSGKNSGDYGSILAIGLTVTH